MSYLISWFNKIANFIFGRFKFFIVLLGWILIISGVIFLLKPEKARNKLLGQGFGIIKGLLILAAIYLVLFSISLAGKTAGILSIASLIGALAVIIAFFKLKKQTFIKLQEQFKKIPAPFLRIYAVIQIIIGVLMVILKHRVL
ncbi:MAG: hypothetical protein PHG51_05355 [Candidatus Omnitrophica bacterium]|nr:hypothetical protein [Candidatus Omnitrophota bacterium]